MTTTQRIMRLFFSNILHKSTNSSNIIWLVFYLGIELYILMLSKYYVKTAKIAKIARIVQSRTKTATAQG